MSWIRAGQPNSAIGLNGISLGEYWGKPGVVWYPGGHTGLFASHPAQRITDAALVQSGLLDRHPVRRTDRPG